MCGYSANDDLLQQLERASDSVRSLQASIRRLDEDADRSRRKIDRALDKAFGDAKIARPARRRQGFSEETETALKWVARPVQSLLIRILADGSGEVTIDGQAPFALTEKLTALLCLVSRGDLDLDEIAGFQTLPRVAKRMAAKTHAVTNLVHRLRRRLYEEGHNPFYLETRTAKGAPSELRFRTRKVLVVTDSGSPI